MFPHGTSVIFIATSRLIQLYFSTGTEKQFTIFVERLFGHTILEIIHFIIFMDQYLSTTFIISGFSIVTN